jgi:hypothetical protein
MTIQYKTEPTRYVTKAFVHRILDDGILEQTEATRKVAKECEYYEPILQSQSITPDGYHLIVIVTFVIHGGIKEI